MTTKLLEAIKSRDLVKATRAFNEAMKVHIAKTIEERTVQIAEAVKGKGEVDDEDDKKTDNPSDNTDDDSEDDEDDDSEDDEDDEK